MASQYLLLDAQGPATGPWVHIRGRVGHIDAPEGVDGTLVYEVSGDQYELDLEPFMPVPVEATKCCAVLNSGQASIRIFWEPLHGP